MTNKPQTPDLTIALGGMMLTMAVNVPMNEALALITVPESREEALMIWQDYSQRWQSWNQIRTFASGLSLFLVALALNVSH